ncbi:MAG: T9SS type A sorting domain-containing protein [Chitinophagaceae bacterium]|nr:T9SS type A sorting domain-containing protein [Chitinophagaceae bacterium]
MRCFIYALLLLGFNQITNAQHVGILRQNYFSTYYDPILNTTIDVLDSSTIRLGRINPSTGQVSTVGNAQYNMGINLTGATINPYANHYIIASGQNLVQFDLNSGQITHNNPITGALPTWAFQNFRFNPSDTIVYGLVPENFYSTYFDSITMTNIQVLDSSRIRFASINPTTAQYTLIGNTAMKNVYTLAGNAINPHQMLFYYSAVDTLVSVDLYTGNMYAQVPIQLPANAIFENFTYSCADTAIYGIVRQNFISTVYDSLLLQYIDVIDSTTFRLAKINPNNGQVSIISPYNLALGATLNGSCFIDPDSMQYYFSNGSDIIGVSLSTGQIISQVTKTYPANPMYFEMMRSTKNCFGAQKVRLQQPNPLYELDTEKLKQLLLFPNPVENIMYINGVDAIKQVRVFNLSGQCLMHHTQKQLNVSSLRTGLYWIQVETQQGQRFTAKFSKL